MSLNVGISVDFSIILFEIINATAYRKEKFLTEESYFQTQSNGTSLLKTCQRSEKSLMFHKGRDLTNSDDTNFDHRIYTN